MKKFNYGILNNYKNNGQKQEQSVRFALTGEILQADNLHSHDVEFEGVNYQIKSEHATIGYGNNLHQCIVDEPSQAYIVALSGNGYLMSKTEFEVFATEFHCHDKDSRTNLEKIRLTRATLKMIEWLDSRL